MTNPRSGHLAEERIQALLDDRLPAGERDAAREHLDRCTACRSELKAWRSVFARLDRIPELSPSPGFADRVMEALSDRRSVAARIRDWLRGLLPDVRVREAGHPDAEAVLTYLDGALPDRRRSTIEGHLEGCAACRSEVEEWRRVFVALKGLERFAPSEGFAEAVLSRVRTAREASVAAEAPPVPGWIERLRPRTWKGWAVAGGVAAAPAAAMVAGVLALFSHPLLTPTNLGAFLWWQVSAASSTLATGAARSAMESPLLFQLWEVARAAAASPGTLGAGALAFSAGTLTAVWILYRNLISKPSPGPGHAHA